MPDHATPQRPMPLPDALSAPFWDAAARDQLQMQSCESCGRMAYPPEISCRACGGDRLSFRPLSGRATLHSWTVLHDPPSPGFRDRLPVILAVVELVEQERLLMSSNLVETDPATLRVGLPLVARFEHVPQGCTLVQFAAAEG